MHKNQVYAMLSESFEENQGSYMDPTALNNLSEIDAGDAEFMASLATEFCGFENSILEVLAEPAKSDVNFFNKLLLPMNDLIVKDLLRENYCLSIQGQDNSKNGSHLHRIPIKKLKNGTPLVILVGLLINQFLNQ